MSRAIGCLLLAVCTAALAAGPSVVNSSFEADRYGNWPGYAPGNGRTVTGWQWKGSVGINPIWRESGRPDHAFSDNGRIPNGRQVAFLQNVAELRQSVAGFEKGKRYRVIYWENARHNNAPTRNPHLKVILGGETIVSEHPIQPVEAIGHRTLPYHYVESAVFTAPRDGPFALVFHTTFGDRVAVLLDHVRIVEVK